jgi:putative ATP-binding cassette transporter
MPVEDAAPASVPLVCRDLRFEQVTYRYGADGSFGVGPLDLHLRQGQVTFIVGGNGSGKSTLAKLLSCHYLPASGRILYDGVALDRDNLGRARLAASAIYLDFFLFPRLFSHSEADLAAAGRYLHRLGLGHKVSLEGDRFSTTDLSAGQRKRLALLTAYVENRNLYVFDEWAADQDPEFKHVFYTDILPAFRRQGKIVAVISHDDKYFSQADQIVWMEHGQIVRTERRAASGATAPPGEGNLTSQPEYSNERR